MGYEFDKVESIKLYDRETGEEVGELHNLEAVTEEIDIEPDGVKYYIGKGKEAQFTATGTIIPPRPNIRMVISPGDSYRNGYTTLCFYRPKYYNWFQRFMYKICFGITIEQGDVVRRDYF